MFSEVTLAPEIEDFLRGLDVPVRVLDGGAGQLNPQPNWTNAHLAGHARRECLQDGLTIVSWGSDHDAGEFAYVPYLSGDAYNDGRLRNLSREFVNDQLRNEQSYMPPVAGRDSATLARMDPDRRIVWFNFSLAPHAQGGLDLGDVDLYKILGEPIMRVLGADRLPRTTERARTLFLEHVASGQNTARTRIERSLHEQRTHIENYAEYIRNGYAQIRRLESELAIQRRVTTVCRVRLEERWDALVAHPMLTRITDDGTTLVLTTTPLEIENPDTGERRYLGVIEIKLRHEGHGLSLRLTNVDNPGGNGDEEEERAHPHCPQHSYPCWGGSEARVGELLASHDLPAIVEFTLHYLQSYNPSDSWGGYARLWGFDEDEDEDDEETCMCADCVRLRDGEAA